MDDLAAMYHPGIYYRENCPTGLRRSTSFAWPTPKDPDGERKDLKLNVPKDVRVKQFWALIVYDFTAQAFICNPPYRVGPNWQSMSIGRKNLSQKVYFT